ncbi:MAG: 3-oxoacyl-ACP synthase, partial [Rubrobacter sp.]
MTGSAAGRIVGVGRALGGRIVTNGDLEGVLDTTDDWISTRTGIKARYFVAEGENAATLAIEASRKAIEHAGVDGGSVDLVICGTSTAPESMPSVACLVGEEIGAPGAGAMDLAAACAGFSYAAAVASSML